MISGGIGKEEVNIQTPSGIVVYRDGVATFPGFSTAEPDSTSPMSRSCGVRRAPSRVRMPRAARSSSRRPYPNFSGYHGSVEAQYGDYNDVRLRAVLNAPVNDTFAVRVALNGEREDSFYSVSGPHSGDPVHRRRPTGAPARRGSQKSLDIQERLQLHRLWWMADLDSRYHRDRPSHPMQVHKTSLTSKATSRMATRPSTARNRISVIPSTTASSSGSISGYQIMLLIQ